MNTLKVMRIVSIILALLAINITFLSQVLALEYTVKSGDTLSNIATQHGVSVAEIMRKNGLSGDLIYVGQTLTIPEEGIEPEYAKPVKPIVKPEVGTEELPGKMEIEVPTPEMKSDKSTEKPKIISEDEPMTPGTLRFKWSFVARIDPAGRNKVVNIAEMVKDMGSEKPALTAGDKISFYVEPGENTYVYIYLVDSRGNLEPIFPTSMDMNVLASEFTNGNSTYIPGKFEWFSLDENKGTETFYVIASSTRLKKLEELTSNYINTEGDKEVLKQMVLDEIKGQKKLVAFNNPVERPISYGGKIRGLEIDISKMAVEVTGKDMYTKTIRLEHE